MINEFKYAHISTGDLVREEIKKKSKIGEEIEKYELKGELVPTETIISLLIRAIVTTKNSNFLIDGFPRSMEQALFFEKYIKEIKLVLNFEASEEVTFNRIIGRREKYKRDDDADEDVVRNRLKVFREQSKQVISYYHKFGIVRNINAELGVNEVYEQVKQELYPTIFCVIGKKYSGKTNIAELLFKRMEMKVIDYKEFLKDPLISKRKDDDVFVITSFINRLREEESARVIIEDFPTKKEHYSLFTKNCKNIHTIFYLNVDDNNVSERMRKMGIYDPNYIGSSQLNNLLYQFEKNKGVIEHLKNKTKVVEVDINNYLHLVINDLVSKIEPTILLFSYNKDNQNNHNTYHELTQHFKENLQYEIVDVKELIKENIERSTPTGRELEKYQNDLKNYPIDLVLNILKSVLFKQSNNRYILKNFPNNCEELKEFELNVCKIKNMVYINTGTAPIEKNSIELYFKKHNRLFIYSNHIVDNYLVGDILGANRDVNIVYGMPLSGKTVITNHLEKKYNFKLIDFKKVIEDLKKKKEMHRILHKIPMQLNSH